LEKEFSAGAIIFRKEKGQALFLLIYSARNKIWGFPKGHIEPGEAEKDAAVWEVKEETGITDLRLIDGFREEDVYGAKSNRKPNEGNIIEKHSIYFLAQTDSSKIVSNTDENTDNKWLAAKEAEKLLLFESMKKILKKANSAIEKHG
jgi:8-oxo-dGTP pyrophosphatase MutT (NUDIX family)